MYGGTNRTDELSVESGSNETIIGDLKLIKNKCFVFCSLSLTFLGIQPEVSSVY